MNTITICMISLALLFAWVVGTAVYWIMKLFAGDQDEEQ